MNMTPPRFAASLFLLGFILLLPLQNFSAESTSGKITWKECLRQKREWYSGAEARRIAENVLLHQRKSGGWPKNIDMAAEAADEAKMQLQTERGKANSTIDNGGTTQPMSFLAQVCTATKDLRFGDAFLRGLDFLLSAQYANGGWPQVYPNPKGYQAHITFNDGAMAGVLNLLREIGRSGPDYRFVDETRRRRAEKAVAGGIECILNTQVIVNGKRTVWCAQHDEKTLAPASARTYEKISLSGSESVGLTRFLMDIEQPDTRVVAAVEAAVAWFRSAKLTGIRVVSKPDPSFSEGHDKIVVKDTKAPPLWARFYEIGSNRPIFCGRDGVIKYSLAEIEHERRVGYGWYGDAPAKLLETDYPAWRERVSFPPPAP